MNRKVLSPRRSTGWAVVVLAAGLAGVSLAWVAARQGLGGCAGPGLLPATGAGGVASLASRDRTEGPYGRLPLAFEANRGQADPQVRFLSRGHGYCLFLTDTGATLVVQTPGAVAPGRRDRTQRTDRAGAPGPARTATIRMRLEGIEADSQLTGSEELPGRCHYFLGNDPSRWRTNVPTYAKVRHEGAYPGIDLVYYGNQGELEYDLVVAPGADPDGIALSLEAEPAAAAVVCRDGDLVVATAGGEFRLRRPVAYQEAAGLRQEVAVRYALETTGDGRHRVCFEVAAYDDSRALVIDPVFAYSTYLGGTGVEQGYGIRVDATGHAYACGRTESLDFPRAGTPYQAALDGFADAYVTKLDPTGTGLVYSTYLGGLYADSAVAIAIDPSGNAYVAGATGSLDFPTTAGAFQTTCGGALDAFVAKLGPDGSQLLYSTYLGGSRTEGLAAIAVDGTGRAYVGGDTFSANFPTQGALQPFQGATTDGFVARFSPGGSALEYSTFLGGSDSDGVEGIDVDSSSNAYVAGETRSTDFPVTSKPFQRANRGEWDAFATKLNPDGTALVYSTYLGGSSDDRAFAIAGWNGSAYLTGSTESSDFPTKSATFPWRRGYSDAFVTRLHATGSKLYYSTFLGGEEDDYGMGIAVDAGGSACVVGTTYSLGFPTTFAPQSRFAGGSVDAFVTRFLSGGPRLGYSTYLGGDLCDYGEGVAVDNADCAYVTGSTQSGNFPASGFQQFLAGASDGFVTKVSSAPLPGPDLCCAMPMYSIRCTVPPGGGTCTVKGDFFYGNNGTEPAPASRVAFYVSADGNYDPGADAQIAQLITRPLAPGAMKRQRVSLPVPFAHQNDVKFVIQIIDPDNTVPEANDFNNTSVTPVKPFTW